MPDYLYLRLDSGGKPVFVLPHGQAITVATAQKWFPQIVGLPTAQAMQRVQNGEKGSIAIVPLKTVPPIH